MDFFVFIPYIYTLSDPISLEVKYIGKTKNMKDRLQRHMSPSYLKETWQPKVKWLKYLKNNNLYPIMELLDVGDENNIDKLEIYWISQFKSWGFKLKNATKGGDGFDWTGRKHDKESVKKMKMNHPLRKVIQQFDINTNELINEFLSSHDAEKELKLCRTHITRCCNGNKNYNTVGGFYFRFKDNYFDFVKSKNTPCVIIQIKNDIIINEYKSYSNVKKNGYSIRSIRNSLDKNIIYRECIWKRKDIF